MLADHVDGRLGGPGPTLERWRGRPPTSTRSTRNLRNGTAASTDAARRSGSRAGQVGRIDARREVGDGDLEVVLLLPLVEALGGRLAGGVGVEGQHELPGVAPQQLHVVGGEGGAAGGHRGGQPGPAKPMTSV